jgi:DNA-binding GntR family transcriptional regulator
VVRSKGKLPSRLVLELTERHRIQSLRQLANEYGVSHEAIRRAIARAKNNF